jgi:hypothetical protein
MDNCDAMRSDGRPCSLQAELELEDNLLCRMHAPGGWKRRRFSTSRRRLTLPRARRRRHPARSNLARIRIAFGLAVSVVALAYSVIPASAGDTGRCLNNAGQRSIELGTSYTDAYGLWICRPDDANATAGGWVLFSNQVPTALPPSITALPAESPAPSQSGAVDVDSKGSGGIDLSTYAGLVVLTSFAVLSIGAVIVSRARAPHLAGRLVVRLDGRRTEVELARFGRRVRLGTKGAVRVQGPGVEPLHAEIRAVRSDEGSATLLRPMVGSVVVLRRRKIIPVVLDLALRDGDVVLLGEARIKFLALAPT